MPIRLWIPLVGAGALLLLNGACLPLLYASRPASEVIGKSITEARQKRAYDEALVECRTVGPPDQLKGELHRQSTGKVVFARAALNGDSPASSVMTSARLSDVVHATVFLHKPFGRYCHQFGDQPPRMFEQATYELRFFVDDKQWELKDGLLQTNVRGRIAGAPGELTTFNFPLATESSKFDPYELRYPSPVSQQLAWADILRHLSPGDHKIRVEVWGYTEDSLSSTRFYSEEPLASGELAYRVKKGEQAPGLPLPKAKMTNAMAERELVRRLPTLWEGKVLKVILADKVWKQVEFGYATALWVVTKQEDGTCDYYKTKLHSYADPSVMISLIKLEIEKKNSQGPYPIACSRVGK